MITLPPLYMVNTVFLLFCSIIIFSHVAFLHTDFFSFHDAPCALVCDGVMWYLVTEVIIIIFTTYNYHFLEDSVV